MAEITQNTEHVDSRDADYDYIRSYLLDSQLRRLSAGTIQGYESNLRIVTTFLHSRGFSILELDKDRLRLVLDYLISERKLNEKTLNNYYCAISSFFDYLTYENVVESNPVQGFRKRYLKNYKKTQSPRNGN